MHIEALLRRGDSVNTTTIRGSAAAAQSSAKHLLSTLTYLAENDTSIDLLQQVIEWLDDECTQLSRDLVAVRIGMVKEVLDMCTLAEQVTE